MVLREVMRGVPDAAAFEARQAGGAPVGAVLRSVRELGESEWAVARDVVTEVQPGVPIPRTPWRSTGASVGATGPASACNADAVAVLGDWLGYDEDAVPGADDRWRAPGPGPLTSAARGRCRGHEASASDRCRRWSPRGAGRRLRTRASSLRLLGSPVRSWR